MLGTSKNIWGFDPRSVPGCSLWLDGADTSSMTFSGSTITQWNDKSGNGYNATSTGTPTYVSTGGVNFNGSSYFLNQTFTMNLSQRSIFIVMQETSRTTSAGVFSFIPNPSSGQDYATTTGLAIETVNGLRFLGNFTNGGYYLSVFGNSTLLVKAIYNDNMNGTTGSGYLNGTNSTNVTADYTASTCSGYIVGKRWTENLYLNGVIYEVIIFNTPLTTSQRQQVEGYLSHKWGLNGYYDSSIPLSIPGCQLWLDAADAATITLASGSNVSLWGDKSGLGNNLSNTSGTFSTRTTTPGGYPSIFVNGGQLTSISNNTTTGNLSRSLFMITQTVGGASRFGTGPHGAATPPSTYGHDLNVGGNGIFCPYVYTASDITFSGANSNMYCLFSDYNSATSTLRGIVNFTLTASKSTTLNTTATPWYLGYRPDGVGVSSAHVCEIILYNSSLTTTQRQSIEGYLARKWGLTSMYSALPSSHPFSSIRPHLRTFQPTDIPGCQLWLDGADQSSLVLSGSNVTQWSDKSGNGRNGTLFQNYPTYTTNRVNFNGTQGLATSLSPSTNIESGFVICGFTSVSSVNTLIGSFVSENGGRQFRVNNAIQTIKQDIVAVLTSGTSLENNTTYLCEYVNNGTTLTHYLNGNSYASGGSVTYTAGGNITSIGYRSNNNGYNEGLYGYIQEVLIFNTALTTSQRQQVEGYLAHKWGLTPSYSSTTPLSISGCTLWLDGADPAGTGVTPSNGATVSTWVDKSGNGLTVSAASSQPTYVTNAANGLGTVAFNGSQGLSAGTVTGTKLIGNTNSCAIYAVVRFENTSGRSIPYSWDDQTYEARFLLQYAEGNNIALLKRGATATTIPLINTLYYIVSYWQNGLNTQLNVNGTTIASLSNFSNNDISSFSRVFNVGYYANDPAGWNMRGNIAEIIFFNTHIPNDFKKVEGYLARKWGISISTTLPSLHPFKSILPATAAHFSPTSITGCKIWFDAFDASYTTSGTTVTAWTNKTGNANASTGGGTVSIGQASLNGKSSVRFPAGTNYLTVGAQTYSTSYRNVFFVVTVGPAGSHYWYLNCNDSICGQCYSWQDLPGDIEINRSGANGLVTNNPSGFFSSTSVVSICTSSGGNTGIWVNGVSQTLAANNVGTGSFWSTGTTSTTITLGGENGRTTGRLDVYELLQYDGSLTSAQRTQIEGYLAHKWGLTNSLPSKHPYKPSPPIFPPNLFFPTPSMYSALFSSANNPSLTIPANAALTLGTNNHTIEFWLYQTSRGQYDVSFSYGNTSFFATNNYFMSIGTNIGIVIGNGAGNWAINIGGGEARSLNTWHHYAFVRNGTTFTLYINGTSVGSATSSVNIPAQGDVFRIGNTTTYPINGYMTNFRLVNGTAVYTSNFTPPTTPLTAIPNTQVLIQGLVDRGPNAFTVTNNGSVTLSTSVSPF